MYHFHTRTKTGRAPQLDDAAPDVWIEVSPTDADAAGIDEGDVVDISSCRATIRARVRICGIRTGVVFVPFHYGYWDHDTDRPHDDAGRAANELTRTSWDPVSKQPMFKVAAVRLTKVADADGIPSPAPTVGGPAPLGETVPPTVGGDAALATSNTDTAR